MGERCAPRRTRGRGTRGSLRGEGEGNERERDKGPPPALARPHKITPRALCNPPSGAPGLIGHSTLRSSEPDLQIASTTSVAAAQEESETDAYTPRATTEGAMPYTVVEGETIIAVLNT